MDLIYSFAWGYLFYFILYSIYIELSVSGLTNIWYRIGSDGYKHVNIASYFAFLIKPFSDIQFWYPMNWDLNYFVGATITSGLLYLSC